VDALRCAVEVQREMALRNAGVPPENRIEFRIGIHRGDIVVEDGDIFGDGVNVAARLEGLAEPGGICVSSRVQEDAAGRLDLAFKDMGEQALKNIARPVRAYRIVGIADAAATQPSAGPALPDKPSIAVLPFANLSGDPEQEYFVDGMVEEIITALSRIRWFFVLARNSSFSYKGQSPDVKRVGRELGVRYLIEGSVRKTGGRVRITAQLIDAHSGVHLWADRFDGSLEDVFDLQDKVASSVAGIIEPALQAAETVRSAGRPTDDLTAYDLYLRGYAMYFSSARQVPEVLRLMEQAIERDSHYGPALAWAAVCCHRLLYDNRSEDREGDRSKGIVIRSGAGAQSQLLARLAPQGFEAVGGPAGGCDRTLKNCVTPQSSRPYWLVACQSRRRIFRQSTLRRGRAGAAPRGAGGPDLAAGASLPRRVPGSHGSVRRGSRSGHLAAPHYLGSNTGRQLLAKSGAPRALPVGPAHGDGRGEMNQTRRLAAILAADVAGYSRLMGAGDEGTLE